MKLSSRLREWSRLLSEYAAAQVTVQLLGLLAGLWLVNLLPVREYALYTFALSFLTFLAVFSDLGVSNALLFFRRETRASGEAFEPYVRAAYRIRYALLALGAVAAFTFMAISGHERGFANAEIGILAIALVAAVWTQVGAAIALLQMHLAGLFRPSYWAEVCGNAARLAAVAVMWAASARWAWLAVLTGVIGSWLTKVLASRTGSPSRPASPADDPTSERAALLGIVRMVLPMSLSAAYFAIQAPLTVWLSAYFAGTQSVAEVGALARLGIIFGLVSSFVGTVLLPRLSVVTDDAHYLRRHLQFCGFLTVLGGAIVGAAWLVPEWFLFLLGATYAGLREGVLLIAVSSVLATWGGYMVAINNARGWLRLQPVVLGVFAAIQVSLIAMLDLTSTTGVLYYGLWSNLAGLVLQAFINAAGFMKSPWVCARK
jgi:O-antigen/teichoic acid export membrane protein